MQNEVQQPFSPQTDCGRTNLLLQLIELLGTLTEDIGELYKLHREQAQRLNALDNDFNQFDREQSDLHEEAAKLHSKTGAAQC